MSTVIRSELSHKNKYHIDKHRYYELKHFCLQYPEWKKAYAEVDAMAQNGGHERTSPTNRVSDMTAVCAEKKLYYLERMELVHTCAKLADPELSEYIVKAVTSNLGYAYLKTKLDMPASKDKSINGIGYIMCERLNDFQKSTLRQYPNIVLSVVRHRYGPEIVHDMVFIGDSNRPDRR